MIAQRAPSATAAQKRFPEPDEPGLQGGKLCPLRRFMQPRRRILFDRWLGIDSLLQRRSAGAAGLRLRPVPPGRDRQLVVVREEYADGAEFLRGERRGA